MKATRLRLILALLALTFSLSEVRVSANVATATCLYAGEAYSEGACRGGQRCSGGNWVDDTNCPKASGDDLAS